MPRILYKIDQVIMIRYNARREGQCEIKLGFIWVNQKLNFYISNSIYDNNGSVTDNSM